MPENLPADARDASAPSAPSISTPKKDRSHWLYIAVIIAVIGGIIYGLVAPDAAK